MEIPINFHWIASIIGSLLLIAALPEQIAKAPKILLTQQNRDSKLWNYANKYKCVQTCKS